MSGTAAGARKGWKVRKAPERERVATLTRIVKKAARYAQQQRTSGGYVAGIQVNLQKIEEEYAPQLGSLDTRLSTFQQMGNEAKIAAVLRGNILPLLSAVRWKVEGGTQEQRDLISQNLLRQGDPRFWCETSWRQRLLERLESLRYGFSIHGKTWDTVDGYRIFRRLTYLHPKSMGGPLGAWEWSEDGTRLVAIHRHYRKPNTNQQVVDERIPIEEIDATVWWQTGENWEGSPLIRPMYGAWIKKDLSSKIAMIALMNGGVGIPMGTLGPGQGTKQGETLKTQAQDLRGGSKERQFLILENGQKMEFLTTNGQIVDARPMIQEQNLDILTAGAMDFMGQGQTASGSRAGSSVMMVAYMQQLEAVSKWLQEQINHGAGYLKGSVEELIYANFTDVKECPEIIGSCVSPSDQLDNVTLLIDATKGGALPRSFSTTNAILDRLGYPIMTRQEYDEAVGGRSPVDIGTPSGSPEAAPGMPAPGSQRGRPNSATPIDRNEPRNDKLGRAFGLTAQKKTPGVTRPTKNSASYPWLR